MSLKILVVCAVPLRVYLCQQRPHALVSRSKHSSTNPFRLDCTAPAKHLILLQMLVDDMLRSRQSDIAERVFAYDQLDRHVKKQQQERHQDGLLFVVQCTKIVGYVFSFLAETKCRSAMAINGTPDVQNLYECARTVPWLSCKLSSQFLESIQGLRN